MIFSFYHAATFLLRRTESSTLYFFLSCLAMAGRFPVINEQILLLLLPSIPWSIHVLLTRILASVSYLYAAVIVLTPPTFVRTLFIPFQGVIIATGRYDTAILIVLTRRRSQYPHKVARYGGEELAVLRQIV